MFSTEAHLATEKQADSQWRNVAWSRLLEGTWLEINKSNRLEDEDDDDYDEDEKAEEGFLDWNISSHDEGGVGVWTQTPHLSVDDNFSICLALPCMEAHFCHD